MVFLIRAFAEQSIWHVPQKWPKLEYKPMVLIYDAFKVLGFLTFTKNHNLWHLCFIVKPVSISGTALEFQLLKSIKLFYNINIVLQL